MLAKERQNIIINELIKKSTISVKPISKELKVSMETIRRDLKNIAQSNPQVKRLHGGAYLCNNIENQTKENSKTLSEEQLILANISANIISDGDIIMFDDSLQSQLIVDKLLKKNIKARIITNSLEISKQIGKSKNLKLFCLGGNLNIKTSSFKGKFTLETLKNMHSTKSFLSPNAISKDFGFSNMDEFQSRINNTMIKNSNKAYIVMQKNKFDTEALTKAASLSEINTIISSAPLSEDWRKILKKNNVNLIYPKL